MNVYYLAPPQTNLVERLSNPFGGSHRVAVRGGEWYAARLQALQHAAGVGVGVALVMVGHARVLHARSLGNAGRADPTPTTKEDQHGLLLYLARLLAQHAGVVLVPPLAALPRVPMHGGDFMATLPSVAAYRVKAALQSAEPDGPGLEQTICASGYRAMTLGDYFHDLYGSPVLQSSGTSRQWKQAHSDSMKELL
jgi:hypothetical protein